MKKYTLPNDRVYPGILPKETPIDQYKFFGLSKREFFAASAMQGLLAKGIEPEEAARKSITAADAMITQLNENLIEE